VDRIPRDARDALTDLAEGRIQRSKHALILDGADLALFFEKALEDAGFKPLKVRDLAISKAVRYPAWVIREGTAHFGHVFQEKFTEEERRTLFGSVVRDWRGDWELMLTRRSRETVWVNLDQGAPFDEDRPSGGLG
jgi:hypothetical protein